MTPHIKVGDKVRFKGDYAHCIEDALDKEQIYTVADVDFDHCELSVPCTAYGVDVSDLELIEPRDRKTEFLTRLQSILKEFDAVMDFEADYGYSVGFSLCLSGEEVFHDKTVTDITADNIMDFEKE